MTPKEKAQEIFDKYFDEMLSFGFYLHNTQINKLALIAVDEILNIEILKRGSKLFNRSRFFDQVDYWQEVKKEIEAL